MGRPLQGHFRFACLPRPRSAAELPRGCKVYLLDPKVYLSSYIDPRTVIGERAAPSSRPKDTACGVVANS
jgi:hypothetical protein